MLELHASANFDLSVVRALQMVFDKHLLYAKQALSLVFIRDYPRTPRDPILSAKTEKVL
jgi:hypothetical protein